MKCNGISFLVVAPYLLFLKAARSYLLFFVIHPIHVFSPSVFSISHSLSRVCPLPKLHTLSFPGTYRSLYLSLHPTHPPYCLFFLLPYSTSTPHSHSSCSSQPHFILFLLLRSYPCLALSSLSPSVFLASVSHSPLPSLLPGRT